MEIELAGPNSSTKKTLRASTAMVENEDGQTIGMVSVLSDITKQKGLDMMKDAFVSNVSHELRAPLISIQKSIGLILETAEQSFTPQQKQFLEIANNNANRLTDLVNDLLDVAKLEAGKTRIEYSRLKLKTSVDEVYEMLRSWANSRGLSLIQEGLEGIEFDADSRLLNQVFTNLVGNAIKFTPSGGNVSITAQCSDKEVKISVRDTGCGVPLDSRERIFEKFEQIKNVPVSGSKGTGLGLAIVKEIIQLHGGKIWVESEEGRGSNFIFVLPKEVQLMDGRD